MKTYIKFINHKETGFIAIVFTISKNKHGVDMNGC